MENRFWEFFNDMWFGGLLNQIECFELLRLKPVVKFEGFSIRGWIQNYRVLVLQNPDKIHHKSMLALNGADFQQEIDQKFLSQSLMQFILPMYPKVRVGTIPYQLFVILSFC
jgi:hypothetical protein